MGLTLYPAIDLKDGACVRLRRGEMDSATIYSDDPGAQARAWQDGGTATANRLEQRKQLRETHPFLTHPQGLNVQLGEDRDRLARRTSGAVQLGAF